MPWLPPPLYWPPPRGPSRAQPDAVKPSLAQPTAAKPSVAQPDAVKPSEAQPDGYADGLEQNGDPSGPAPTVGNDVFSNLVLAPFPILRSNGPG